MNLQNDEFYKNILNDYFMETQGSKLFRAFIKLDKKEDSFEVKTDDKEKEVLFQEMNHILISIENENIVGPNEYIGLTSSGVAGMNPAVIHMEVKEDGETAVIEMKAYAGEGLIKQNTADKAMKQVKEYFGAVDMDEL